MRLYSIIVAVVAIPINFTTAKSTPEIPEFLQICHRNDPNLNECVKHSVESLREHLKDGISALHIPSCEPLTIPEIEITQATGPVSIKSRYTNVEISGATDFDLKSLKIDTSNDRVKMKIHLPRLEITADYAMNGWILMLAINGNGVARSNYTDVNALARMQGERYERPKTGMTHLRVTDFYVDLSIGHASFYLDNLLDGDDTLSDAMNLFLNDNWKSVTAELKPALEESISELFKNFTNKIYAEYPLDVLLPA